MVPGYGSSRRLGTSAPWSMLRPGPRSALPTSLTWLPLGPADNPELAALIARAEAVDDPPYRTTELETAEYFADPVYTGVAGRDPEGVMRAFAIVRIRPARELYASMAGVVDPQVRGQGIGEAIVHWQAERARHLIGVQRIGEGESSRLAHAPAHIVTTVLEDDHAWREVLDELGFAPKRWYREVRRSLAEEIPVVELDRFMTIEPMTEDLDELVRTAHNQAFADVWGAQTTTRQEWVAGRPYFAREWSFVAFDRSGDRRRVAGYLCSSRYEQDWEALGWTEGYTDILGVLADYRHRDVARALLTTAMRAYRDSGMDYAAGGVDSDNPSGAVGLYQELGYLATRGTILYSLDI